MTIANKEIANLLRKISYLMEIELSDNKNVNFSDKFKVRSYTKAADCLENLSENVESIYLNKGLDGLLQIPYIGKAIGTKIEEFITTGKISYFEQLESKIPIHADEFMNLHGIGPLTIKKLYTELQIKTIDDLKKAAMEGKIRNISGFSISKENNILKKIEMLCQSQERFLIGDVYPLVKKIEEYLSSLSVVNQCITAGSFRRMKETIGDIDYVISSSDPIKVIDLFTQMPEVKEIINKGLTKSSVKLTNGIRCDLLVVHQESFGSALQYFTGSKEHGIKIRRIANSKGYRLNEWGLFIQNSQKKIDCYAEQDVYNKLGLHWIPPELRENTGEIDLAKIDEMDHAKNNLPTLVEYGNLKGDLQVHSNNTDGQFSIEDMAFFAKEKFGLEYIAITDHTKSLKIAKGLDENQLLDQANKIMELNDKLNDGLSLFSNDAIDLKTKNEQFKIFTSAEVNILKDGSLDISNNTLDKLDIVGAAIHSNFSLSEETQTNRLIKAAENPHVDIIFHPTGRIINKRDGYSLNISKIIETASKTKTILEIDSHYNRLDLKDEYIKLAVENNVKLVIDSDAHHPIHFAFLRFGIGQARRGWASKNDILNTLPSNKLIDCLK